MRGPRQDPPRRRREAGPRSPALLRPRPRHRRRGARARQARRLVPAGTQPRDHRRVPDPGHPRCRAVRPDPHPHRPRTRPARRQRRCRRPSGARSRDPRRPPVRPGPHVRPRRSRPHPGARRGDEPVRPPHPRRPRRARPAGDRCGPIEKLGAATTQLLADWLARYAATGGKVTLRPVIDLDPDDPDAARPQSTRTTRPVRCASLRAARRPLRLPRLPHATPGAATSTTSPPTSRWQTADHPARPTPEISRPLCRHHHRLKTHTAWDYKHSTTARYLWTAPTGHQYTVHPASRRPPDTDPSEEPDAPPPRPTPAGDTGTPRPSTTVVFGSPDQPSDGHRAAASA